MAPVCFVVLESSDSDGLDLSFSASQRSSDPFSRAPAIIPLERSSVGWLQAMS